MEGSDVFAQEIAGDEDPFAGTDLEFGEPVEAHPPIETEGLPTVDREGNPVASNGSEPVPTPPPTQESSQPSAGSQSEPQAVAESSGEGDPTPAAPVPPASGGEAAPATELASDPTPPSSASSPATTGDAGSAPTPAAPAPTAPAAVAPPESGQEPSAGSDDGEPPEAAPPDETKDKSGRVTKRRYLIFKVDAPGKLSAVTWYEDNKGHIAERAAGTKRQSVVLARGTEDALKFGYLAAGAPKNGIKLVAVAALHFQPREVKPLPPEPARQRLQIN